MFYFTTKAIDSVCNYFKDHIYKSTAFSRNRKLGFHDYLVHIIFNKRKTIRNNLDNNLKYCTSDIGTYRRQSFSEQRVHIKPEVFKEINSNYLNNISYLKLNTNNPFFRNFYNYRLLAVDGSRFELPNISKTLEEFGFPEDYDRAPNVIFSGVVDVLNDFWIDGIMGVCGVGEMTLAHQNIQNCINLINPVRQARAFFPM